MGSGQPVQDRPVRLSPLFRWVRGREATEGNGRTLRSPPHCIPDEAGESGPKRGYECDARTEALEPSGGDVIVPELSESRYQLAIRTARSNACLKLRVDAIPFQAISNAVP